MIKQSLVWLYFINICTISTLCMMLFVRVPLTAKSVTVSLNCFGQRDSSTWHTSWGHGKQPKVFCYHCGSSAFSLQTCLGWLPLLGTCCNCKNKPEGACWGGGGVGEDWRPRGTKLHFPAQASLGQHIHSQPIKSPQTRERTYQCEKSQPRSAEPQDWQICVHFCVQRDTC